MWSIILAVLVAMSATGFCAGQQGFSIWGVLICVIAAVLVFQIAYAVGVLTVL